MRAAIQQDLDRPCFVADDDDLIVADIGNEIIAYLGNMRAVAHEVPGPRKYAPQFQLINVRICENFSVDHALFVIHPARDLFLTDLSTFGLVPQNSFNPSTMSANPSILCILHTWDLLRTRQISPSPAK